MLNIKNTARGILLSMVAISAMYAAPTKVELDDMTKIIGYFPEWGIYDGHDNYAPAKVPFNQITHVNYAFATIKDGVIAYFDNYAATEVTHGEVWDSLYKGNLGQFEKLKKDYPHLSVLISIGGWTQSGNFHDVAATQENRDRFASSTIQYIRAHKMDGLDIDWEYPGSYREPDLVDNANDQGTPKADESEKETFTLLLQTLRAHLDKAGTEDGKYYQLSAAVSAGFEQIEFSDPAKYEKYLDFINIMTYDMHGAWDSTTNHQSALYANSDAVDDLNIDSVIEKFASYGVDKKKLIIGTPFYSRGWKGVVSTNPQNGYKGLFSEASGGANGIWDGGRPAGVNPYTHMLTLENDPSFTKYYDNEAKVPYLYSEEKGEMYTYEDKQSLGEKVDYVKNNQLGGMIIWELSGDAPVGSSDQLLSVMSTGFYPNGIEGTVSTETTEVETTEPTSESGSTSTTTSEPNNNTGTWNTEAVYIAGDIVSYSGEDYKAKWWTQGNIPGTEEYGPWELLEEGVTNPVEGNVTNTEGSNTENTNNESTNTEETNTVETSTGTWSSSTVYVGSEVVVYNDVKYQAQWWTQGNVPGTEEYGPWKVVSDTTAVTSTETEPVPTTPTVETNTSSGESGTETVEGTVSLSALEAKEATLTDTPLMNLTRASIRTLDNVEVELVSPLRTQNPTNVKRVESIITEAQWEYLFAQRSSEYTYTNFLKATAKFPAFCGDYDDGRDAESICRKSLATMFAHFGQETGGHTAGLEVPEWRQGLVHIREMGWDETMRGGYNSECNPDIWQGQAYPCGTFDDGEYKSYFGRGAKQLSYNYNYGAFSEAMTGDVKTLLDNPNLVAETWYNLASAVFFFVYPQPPKPSMLHTIDRTWTPNQNDKDSGLLPGFGVTTNIINGGVECGGSSEIAQSLNRISYYEDFSNYLDVPIESEEVLGCANMKQFGAEGAGALPIYWEEDWSWSSQSSDGRSYSCQLVNYQTAYSAFKDGDYVKCVEDKFSVTAE